MSPHSRVTLLFSCVPVLQLLILQSYVTTQQSHRPVFLPGTLCQPSCPVACWRYKCFEAIQQTMILFWVKSCPSLRLGSFTILMMFFFNFNNKLLSFTHKWHTCLYTQQCCDSTKVFTHKWHKCFESSFSPDLSFSPSCCELNFKH